MATMFVLCSDDGEASVDTKVPDTITQWIGNAVCMNYEDGLGVSAPAALTAFQPFFVSMNLPYSVIRTEKLQVKLTVSNYLTKCMAVSTLRRLRVLYVYYPYSVWPLFIALYGH